MKSLIVLLFSCLALKATNCQDVFDMTEMKEGFRWMVEDGEFSPVMQGIFAMLEMQICPVESSECNVMENWIFGCNCRNAFDALSDECKRKPCEAFRAFKNNGAQAISSYLDSQNMQEAMEVSMDWVLKPFLRTMCQCPKLIDVSMTCIQKYDGMYFEMAEINREMFDEVVSNIDWKSLKKVAKAFLAESWCGVGADGADCVEEMARTYQGMALFVDNTMAGEDVCMSGVRFMDKLNHYLVTINNFTTVDNVIGAFLDMEKAALCDRDCADDIAEEFYSCCAKNAMEVARQKTVKKALVKVVKSVWPLISEDKKIPNTNKLMNYLNLEKFCGKKTDAYKRINDKCDALEA